MLSRRRTIGLSLSTILAILTAPVLSDGTVVDLGLFTQAECIGQPAAPYVGNATIAIGTCLTTVGAVSIFVPTTVCSGTDVSLYGYSNAGCAGQYDDIGYSHFDGCYTWESGAFGSIVLSCGSTAPGSVVGYTTVSVAPVATNPAGTTGAAGAVSTGSGSSGTSSSSTGSTGSSSSDPITGWNALTTPARSGIIAGAVVFAVLVAIAGVFTRRHQQVVVAQGPRETTETFHQKTVRNW